MYLYGASGHAKVIADILRLNGTAVDGIFDDDAAAMSWQSMPVSHRWNGESPLIIAIGDNKVRAAIAERLCCEFGTAIHRNAVVSPSVTIEAGTVVMAGAVINADARVGKHCIVNTGATIDHECVLSDYVHVSPHATLCGNVHVGIGSWIAAGATVIPGVKIGKWCTIGAGAVVLHDVDDNTTVVGCPARDIKDLTLFNMGGVKRRPSTGLLLLPPQYKERA